MLTLGIETSCDETACGIVDHELNVLANKIFTQEEYHRRHGGVVPEIAARAHLEKINDVVQSAIDSAGISAEDIDLIAFTRGPGLIGPLLVGASFAMGMGSMLGKPAKGVNHLEGHLGAAYLNCKALSPPFICLTVSGGHTEICLVQNHFKYQIIGKTRDDAAGEAFDKCGKILQLGYPAGPIISKLAKNGNRDFIRFPQGMNMKNNFEFSFSGLKTAFLRKMSEISEDVKKKHLNDICASLESAIVEILVKKTIRAAHKNACSKVVVCGGVSANHYLRQRMQEDCTKQNLNLIIPELAFCTDNGAMIAAIAQLRENQHIFPIRTQVKPSLSWND
ncbi:MAG: tRNA (adenosine(37)-N6)-threonylcarbamoyltransferase complex transferase subunit TsaD [Fibrobacteria bacterium]|nr:tRNA (adenosine(37)-N6)-threonylcarbamoyltransferase complex transferase subunit TsaD [Fibrobacteria bacterium]